MHCRFCGNIRLHKFVDLGHQPPSNSYLTERQLDEPEVYYPLKLYVCDRCWLVQAPEYKKAVDIFNNGYAYYSSYSKTMVAHAKEYVDMITQKLGIDEFHSIIEIASNDGYLLQHFPNTFRRLGIEPAQGPAQESRKKGIDTVTEFFGTAFVNEYRPHADLIIANNVLAHVPDLNDFVEAIRLALRPEGTATLEFPHLVKLIEGNQFDTIYHEHFSYFSFSTVNEVFSRHGLTINDVEELDIHGGSLRIYASKVPRQEQSVYELLVREKKAGVQSARYYEGFQKSVDSARDRLVEFLLECRPVESWRFSACVATIAAYGAAAKGNTLLNYCGIKPLLLPYVCDASQHKQGMFLPGSHISILSPEVLKSSKPDYLLILPWNIKDEVMEELSYVREWGCQFVTAIPTLEVLE